MNIQFSDLIANAPNAPGIYKMYDADGELLYIGKAKNLSNRLQQYTNINKLELHKQIMRKFVTSIKWEITSTESDALIREQELIKTLKPKYNIMLTDDKMYPMLALTKSEYPRLLKFRGKVSQKHDVYGPYPSVITLNDTIKMLQKVCQLRTCSDTFMLNRTRPCLLHQIGRCSAPCCIQQQSYKNNVILARKILTGDSEPIISKFTKLMKKYAKENKFEIAAEYRDKITALTQTLNCGIRTKSTHTKNIDWDTNVSKLEKLLGITNIKHAVVFDNSHLFGKHAVGAMISFDHNGFIKSKYKHFKLKNTTNSNNDIGMMTEFVSRAVQSEPTIDLIIVDGGTSQWHVAHQIAKNIPVMGIVKGEVRNGDEHFILPNGTKYYDLPKDDPLFLILRAVRDEAHRFVITYHRTTRAKQFTHSCLDDIESIGPKRKHTLLQHFGSVSAIANASLEALVHTPGLGKNAAKKIYVYFHSEML